jgi:hypothetical protein
MKRVRIRAIFPTFECIYVFLQRGLPCRVWCSLMSFWVSRSIQRTAPT